MKDTPTKPPGILLTPGTGTTRRKRVSFGHDVGFQNGGPEPTQRTADGTGRNRKRTRLTTALENASRKSSAAQDTKKPSEATTKDQSDSEWEEEEDGHDAHDVTVDLAEPHSESGKYWKQEFHKYRDDAKVEMDKMLKYKRLAKSYAKLKDAEAMELAEKLRDEQQKVIAMEKKISESASTFVSQQKKPLSDKAFANNVAKLTKQTALVVQYRQRVQELEDQLDEVVRKKEEGDLTTLDDVHSASANDKAVAALQRELRQAQDKVRDADKLKQQVAELQAQLKEAKAGAGAATSESARVRELRSQLRDVKEESRKKDIEWQQIQKEHDTLLASYETQMQQMKDLLSQSQSRYASLKKETAELKANRVTQATRPQSWHPPANVEVTNGFEATDEHSFDLFELQDRPTTRQSASAKQQTLRDKFRKDAAAALSEAEPDAARMTMSKQKVLEPASRQPYVRRSPRNKAYDIGKHAVDALTNDVEESMAAPQLPRLGQAKRQPTSNIADEGVDLLKTQFARLGGPEMRGGNDTVLGNTTAKSTLPPERRAAALARLERKRMERQRTKTRPGADKENMRPIGA
jgi:hypothetical protein